MKYVIQACYNCDSLNVKMYDEVLLQHPDGSQEPMIEFDCKDCGEVWYEDTDE